MYGGISDSGASDSTCAGSRSRAISCSRPEINAALIGTILPKSFNCVFTLSSIRARMSCSRLMPAVSRSTLSSVSAGSTAIAGGSTTLPSSVLPAPEQRVRLVDRLERERLAHEIDVEAGRGGNRREPRRIGDRAASLRHSRHRLRREERRERKPVVDQLDDVREIAQPLEGVDLDRPRVCAASPAHQLLRESRVGGGEQSSDFERARVRHVLGADVGRDAPRLVGAVIRAVRISRERRRHERAAIEVRLRRAGAIERIDAQVTGVGDLRTAVARLADHADVERLHERAEARRAFAFERPRREQDQRLRLQQHAGLGQHAFHRPDGEIGQHVQTARDDTRPGRRGPAHDRSFGAEWAAARQVAVARRVADDEIAGERERVDDVKTLVGRRRLLGNDVGALLDRHEAAAILASRAAARGSP